MSSDFTPLERKGSGVSRWIETKIPLWALLSAIGAASLWAVGLNNKVDRLMEDTTELKATVKSSIVQGSATDGKLLILQWRVDALEQRSGVVMPKR